MDKYDYTKFTQESLLIAIVSTFGNGEPPENGHLFLEMTDAYKSISADRKIRLSEGMRQSSLNNEVSM